LKHGGKEEAEERNDWKSKSHRGGAETRRLEVGKTTAEGGCATRLFVHRKREDHRRDAENSQGWEIEKTRANGWAGPHDYLHIGKEKTTGEGAGAT
jgi:hypothetical protein